MWRRLQLSTELDASACVEVWASALGSHWEAEPVWFHGDITPSNLLVEDGTLAAVIDFGCAAIGDPACDLAIAWTFFTDREALAFRDRLEVDEATWERGRGWALWKALITHHDALKTGNAAAAGLQFGWRSNAFDILTEIAASA